MIRRRALVHDHQINAQPFHPPIFMGANQLAHDLEIVGVVDPNEHDGQVAGNPGGPQLRLSANAALQQVGRGPQGRVRIDHAISETLKKMRFVGVNAQVMQLHLCLRPRQRHCALERGRVVMLVGQVDHFGPRRRDHRPDRRRARLRPPGCEARRRRLKIGSSTVPTVSDSGRPSIAETASRTSRPRPRNRARSVSN